MLLGAPSDTAAGTPRDLTLSQIVRNEDQPRTHFDAAELEALATSVESQGLIQPIAVRPLKDGTFQIIAGERRWLAAQRAGLTRVPVIVHDVDERASLILALVENLVRSDLNPLETARAYAALQDTWEVSVAELARALGKSRPAVANTLRLLELPDEVITLLEQGRLTEGHGRALLGLEDRSAQRRLARKAQDGAMSVRAVEEAVRRDRTAEPSTPRTWNHVPEVELQESFDRVLQALGGTARAKLKTGERAAQLVLRCESHAALLELMDVLSAAMEHSPAMTQAS